MLPLGQAWRWGGCRIVDVRRVSGGFEGNNKNHPEMGVKRPSCELPPKMPPGCAVDPLDARGKVQLGLPLIL